MKISVPLVTDGEGRRGRRWGEGRTRETQYPCTGRNLYSIFDISVSFSAWEHDQREIHDSDHTQCLESQVSGFGRNKSSCE